MALHPEKRESLSRTLSYVLRRRSEKFDLEYDRAGWFQFDELIDALNGERGWIDEAAVREVVDGCAKAPSRSRTG